MPFHSQYGQDKFVAGLIPGRGRIFVEFGALDGLRDSNSLHFEEEKGWSGLLIEANPITFEKLKQNRPGARLCNAAIFDRNGSAQFELIEGGLYGWSGIKECMEPQHSERIAAKVPSTYRKLVSVPCRTLDDVLNQFGIRHIDYLSIDVEGAELALLKVFPFARHSIDVLGVEDNFGNPDLDALLRANGFRFLQTVGSDRFYRWG
jgi:FkbM family methyltransferase